MSDVFTPEQRSAVMRAVKARDTTPELTVRRILRAAGVGYRLGGSGLPGRPDLVMKGRRLAVFVNGCFWHGHDCARGARQPKANATYWSAKVARNRARDATTRAALESDGWRVITVWECGLKTAGFADRLIAEVRGQAAAVSVPASSA
ncbi:MAG: very short patch repair endonuclease [Brevundimonas sp.]|uniref:very short patch repair endonuclease n=1 Tax=Brevundimonas sp. TaxID=1871086 RepID=UPI0027256EA6|nr:very short patch repair endonuclease [Brevundimonas sp.]MDO9588441.1 very short patch repair endonuclease [Brevundimonas sp.]MDP3658314.1 very short patch repair endonuclease [Brevundimonas sp.]